MNSEEMVAQYAENQEISKFAGLPEPWMQQLKAISDATTFDERSKKKIADLRRIVENGGIKKKAFGRLQRLGLVNGEYNQAYLTLLGNKVLNNWLKDRV